MTETTNTALMKLTMTTSDGTDNRKFTISLKNPKSETYAENMRQAIGAINQSLTGGLSNIWLEDKVNYYVTKISKAQIFEQTKTETTSETTIIQSIKTIYEET